MSGGLGSNGNGSFDVDELLKIGARCKELTKEKEMLVDSKSQSFELIKKLECYVKTLSQAREEDKKHIQELERELSKCCLEIDYLQDQLNARNSDLNCLSEEICSLHLKLADMENLEDEVVRLREQMKISDSEQLILIQEIEDKEIVIRDSACCIETLEEAILSTGLDYQCELESTKLELIALEQKFFKAKKLLEENIQQDSRTNELFQYVKISDEESKHLKINLATSDIHTNTFGEKEEEQFNHSLQNNEGQTLLEYDRRYTIPGVADVESRNKMAELTRQIGEYELIVRQLKEELRTERLKSKEEAEELAQEMAELRYQITGLLEEECKRRACIEQISLHRIAELEAQISKEQQKSKISQSLVVRNTKKT